MLNLLKKPYPASGDLRERLSSAAAFGVFVFLFLFIFRPFGLSELPEGLLATTLTYGLITFACMVVTPFLLNGLFPKYHHPDSWTLGKEILNTTLTICIIATANFFFSIYAGFFPFRLNVFFLSIGFTLAVSVFPVGIFSLIKQIRLEKRYTKTSKEINSHINQTPITNMDDSKWVTLLDDEGNQKLEIDPAKIIVMESADNYVQVHIKATDKTERILIRGALNRFETELENHSFFRIHRSFLINTVHIETVNGNARGYTVKLKGVVTGFPVARRRTGAFDERLNR